MMGGARGERHASVHHPGIGCVTTGDTVGRGAFLEAAHQLEALFQVIGPAPRTGGLAECSNSFIDQWQEPMKSAVDGAAVNHQPTLGKAVHDNGVAHAIARTHQRIGRVLTSSGTA